MGCNKSSSNREVYSNTVLPQEISQIYNVTIHLKELEKEEQKNPKVSRRKEIIKIRSEINEMCCWSLSGSVLLRIFASMFISDIGL